MNLSSPTCIYSHGYHPFFLSFFFFFLPLFLSFILFSSSFNSFFQGIIRRQPFLHPQKNGPTTNQNWGRHSLPPSHHKMKALGLKIHFWHTFPIPTPISHSHFQVASPFLGANITNLRPSQEENPLAKGGTVMTRPRGV